MAQQFADQLQQVYSSAGLAEINWLQAQQQQAVADFARLGLPSQRDEDWRYTSLKGWDKHQFRIEQASLPSSAASVNADYAQITLTTLNGKCSAVPTDLPAGLEVWPLAEVPADHPVAKWMGQVAKTNHGFTALNHAYARDGWVIYVAKGVSIEPLLELHHISSGENPLLTLRNLIVLDDSAQLQIVERQLSSGSEVALANNVTEVVVMADAQLDQTILQQQNQQSYWVNGNWATQHERSRYSNRLVCLGGRTVRNDLRIELQGEEAHCDMFGAYYLEGRQHLDNHTTVVHGVPNCTSNEHYKGVLDGRAESVFHGRIVVAQDAQKTDAEQQNNTLMLSRDATANSKPQLEIYADDVKCSHGATMGELDDNSIFYLRSRGVDTATARALLTCGFVNEIIDTIPERHIADELEASIEARLLGDGKLGDGK